MEGKRRSAQPSSSTAPGPAPTVKIDRKTVEKNRRIHMNSLLRTFFQLIPPQHFNNFQDQKMGVAELLEQATWYVVQLKERVQQLLQRKAQLAEARVGAGKLMSEMDDTAFYSTFPVLKVVAMGSNSSLQVVLIQTESNDERVLVSEVIRVLEEEGMEVLGMNMVTTNHKLYHTINAQVKSPRVAVDTSRVAGRLHELLS